MRERYLTISVDDGHPTDSRTAELLASLGLRATFYVPATNPERPILAPAALREVAAQFEVGAHTFTHCNLARLSDEEARDEIASSKAWLEDRCGTRVVAFCYPRGKTNRRTPMLVREAGLAGARTCMLNRSELPRDPYLAGASTQAHSHAAHVQLRHALLEGNLSGVREFVCTHRLARDWATHFFAALAHVDRHGGVAHLYLHSWEIEAQGDWLTLRRVLERAAGYGRLTRITNGALFELAAARRAVRVGASPLAEPA